MPGTIVLRPNDFSQPDYDAIYKDPDGRELTVGRIFRNHALQLSGPGSGASSFSNGVSAPSHTMERLTRSKKPRRHGASAGIPQTRRYTGRHLCSATLAPDNPHNAHVWRYAHVTWVSLIASMLSAAVAPTVGCKWQKPRGPIIPNY